MGEAAITLPTIREALASIERLIEGSVASVSAEDPGLFGPASVTWTICRDPAFAISGLAGLLMAALNPVAMAAIDQHSDYRRDAWRRAHRTTDYVFTITFSGTAEAMAAAEKVRAVHRMLSGTDPLTGRVYRADDPDLLLWVHCVNTWMALAGHEAFASRLSAAQADRYVAEQVRAAELVGLPRDKVPANRAGLAAQLASVALRLSPPATEFADFLLRARMPWTMRGFWALHVLGALMILPAEVRSLYGFPSWLPRGRLARGAVRLVLRLMDASYVVFPPIRRARRHLAAVRREVLA